MTEKEKMLRGELYRTSDPELVAEHRRALRLCREYNDIDPMDDAEMDRVIRELVNVEGKQVTVKQPIRDVYKRQGWSRCASGRACISAPRT